MNFLELSRTVYCAYPYHGTCLRIPMLIFLISQSPKLVLPAIREGSLLLAPTRSQRLRYADELRVHGKDRVNLTQRQAKLVYEWKVSFYCSLASHFNLPSAYINADSSCCLFLPYS